MGMCINIYTTGHKLSLVKCPTHQLFFIYMNQVGSSGQLNFSSVNENIKNISTCSFITAL